MDLKEKGRVGWAYLEITNPKNLCLCYVRGVQLCYGESFRILAAQRTDRWIKRKVQWQVISVGPGTNLAQQAFPFH